MTVDKCHHLDRKHTIFGKVTGPTVFNLIRLSETPTRKSDDRPLDPIPVIDRVSVIINPYDDIVPRHLARNSASK